ncbi:MAG: HU family DNA-binding protein [Magnetococcus sp. DMHC-6]
MKSIVRISSGKKIAITREALRLGIKQLEEGKNGQGRNYPRIGTPKRPIRPRTGAAVDLPARQRVHFKAGKELRER